MRALRKLQATVLASRYTKIFAVVCLGSMCFLGIRTFISIEESNASTKLMKPSSTRRFSKNETNPAEPILNDAITPPAAMPDLAEKKPNSAENDFPGGNDLDISGKIELDQYPGYLSEKTPATERKVDVLPVVKPALLADRGGDHVRPFPGSAAAVAELPLPDRITQARATAQMRQFQNMQDKQKNPHLQMMQFPQDPWPPGQGSIQLKLAPGMTAPPEITVFGNQQLGGAAYFAPQGGPPPQQFQPPTGPDPLPVKEKLIHFDLKGAPPTVAYFKEVFPLLKKLGATGLLMEYEDMYPYTGRLKVTRAGNAYSRQDIAIINKMAAENDLYVIPLVQTFGHLEFALKHAEFEPLREIDQYMSAVCPSRNESFEMVTAMIDQMLAMHPNATYLHIGADEVFQLGACPICSEKVKQNQSSGRHMLFLSYVAQILTYIRQHYPHIRPIMWDDMFHSMTPQIIQQGLGDLVNYVEPMIWSYFTGWTNHLPQMGMLYGPVFPNIWGATAFKGSDGETRQMPVARTQVAIHTSWLEALRNGGRNFKNFRGIALTGWSRYDHFMPLCELFPVAIPTLALSISVLHENGLTLEGVEQASQILNCKVIPNALNFMDFDPNLGQYTACDFPGIDVFRTVNFIEGIRKPIKDYLEELSGKFPEYQMRHGYVQKWRIPDVIAKLTGFEGLLEGYNIKGKEAFAKVYDESVYNEYLAGSVNPLLKRLQAWRGLFEDALNNSTLPARPLFIEQVPPKERRPINLPVAQPVPGTPWVPNNVVPLNGGLPQLLGNIHPGSPNTHSPQMLINTPAPSVTLNVQPGSPNVNLPPRLINPPPRSVIPYVRPGSPNVNPPRMPINTPPSSATLNFNSSPWLANRPPIVPNVNPGGVIDRPAAVPAGMFA